LFDGDANSSPDTTGDSPPTNPIQRHPGHKVRPVRRGFAGPRIDCSDSDEEYDSGQKMTGDFPPSSSIQRYSGRRTQPIRSGFAGQYSLDGGSSRSLGMTGDSPRTGPIHRYPGHSAGPIPRGFGGSEFGYSRSGGALSVAAYQPSGERREKSSALRQIPPVTAAHEGGESRHHSDGKKCDEVQTKRKKMSSFRRLLGGFR